MKAVILAGGLGTRISEETESKPKPMIEIGGRPILWHIMKTFYHYGVTDFVICLGYKGYVVKEFFVNYSLHLSDVTVDVGSGTVDVHARRGENWRVALIETGTNSMTGGRLKRVRDFLGDEDFFMTYGDGVADIDIGRLLAFHRAGDRPATVTAVTPPGRFGALDIASGCVTRFREKPAGDGAKINGGYFVLSPRVLDLIEGDDTVWERGPMETLAARGQLGAYPHDGYWHALDTMRDRIQLEALWATGEAPWRVW